MIAPIIPAVIFLLSQAHPAELDWNVREDLIRKAAEGSVVMPLRAVVKRGTVVALHGRVATSKSDVDAMNAVVYVRSDFDIRAHGYFHGQWDLTWKTAEERKSKVQLSVGYVTKTGEPITEIATCLVTLVDDDPLMLDVKKNSNGSLHARVVPSSNVDAQNVELLINGKARGRALSAGLETDVAQDELCAPTDNVRIQAVALDQKGNEVLGRIASTVIEVPAIHYLNIKPGSAEVTKQEDPFGPRIRLHFDSQQPIDPASTICLVNGIPTMCESTEDSFAIDTSELPWRADVQLALQANTASGIRVYSGPINLKDSGVLAKKSELEQELDTERLRLSRWQSDTLGLVEDLCARFKFMPIEPDASDSYVPSSARPDTDRMFVSAYVHVVPFYIDSKSTSIAYKRALARVLPRYSPHALVTSEPRSSELSHFFHDPTSRPLHSGMSWTELYALLDPTHKALMDLFEKDMLAWYAEEDKANSSFEAAVADCSDQSDQGAEHCASDIGMALECLKSAEKKHFLAGQVLYHLAYDFDILKELRDAEHPVNLTEWCLYCYDLTPSSPDEVPAGGSKVFRIAYRPDVRWWEMPVETLLSNTW